MSDLTISLLGLYNEDPEILDEDHLLLPDDLDRNVLIPMVLSETAELEVLYPDPGTLKIVMRAWSSARSPSWDRMLQTLLEAYDPLHNYDRTETEAGTTTGTEDVTDRETVADATSEDVTDTITEDIEDATAGHTSDSSTEAVRDSTTGTTSTTATGQVTGFNSQTFADNNKTITSGSSSDTASRDRSQATAGDRDESYTRDRDQTVTRDRDETNTRNREGSRSTSSSGGHNRTLRAFGNIGVTTSQQMLSEELRVRMIDIYRIITDELRNYFCLRVY